MKRIVLYGCILILLLSFCGCAGMPDTPDSTPAATPTIMAEPTPTTEPIVTPEPTPDPTPEPLQFTVDVQKIPADQKAFLEDKEALADYFLLMDAVSLQETKITCSTAAAAKAAAEVFAASPYSTLAELTVENQPIAFT